MMIDLDNESIESQEIASVSRITREDLKMQSQAHLVTRQVQ